MSIRSFFTSAARAAVKSVKVAAVQLSNLEENRDEVLSLVKALNDANGAVMVKGYELTLDAVAMAKKLAKGIDMDQEVGIMVGAAMRLNEIARGGKGGEGGAVDGGEGEGGEGSAVDNSKWERWLEERAVVQEAETLYEIIFGLALEHNIDCKIVETVGGVVKAGRYLAHKLQSVDKWKADNLRSQIFRLTFVLNGNEYLEAPINIW